MRSLVLVLALLAPLGESASAAAKNTRVSRDATCGGSKGYTCLGSVWGDCCSQYGWCGSTTAYCGSGCKSAYGSCKRKPAPSSSTTTTTTRPASTTSRRSSTVIVTLPSSTATTSSSLAPVATQRVSQNARCGPKFQGKTCLGSRWGDCCSQYSYCGSTKAYCAADTCQKGFGKCNGGGSSSSRTSSSTAGSSSSSTSLVSSSGAGTASSSSAAVVSSSESSSLVAEISSSATQTSSDSAVVSSSATSTATSSTSNPQPTCFDVPDCDSLAPSINTACSLQANSGKCAAGYQARCGTRPQTGSVEISNSPSTSTGGDACAAACTLDSTCVGFVWTSSFTGVYSCVLYSTITSVTTGFGSTYLKVCDDAVSGSASSVIASSTPTLSIIATTVSASNTIDATSSASPVASVCPYLVPSCLPAQTVSSLDNVNCQAGITCTSRYTMRCNMQVATTAAIIGIRPAIDVEDCASQCDGDLTCLGFAFVKSTSTPVSYSCTFYNHFPRVLQASNTVLYTRVCPSAPMIESSSSLVASSISVASSSLDSSSITPSASESLASSTSASTSVASPSATECPYIVDGTNCPPTDSSLANLASTCPASDSYCTSRYATACGSIPIGGDAVVSSVDTSPNNADSCASTCDQDAACIGFVYSIEDSPDSTFTCKFYSRVGGLTEAGRSDTVAFLKYCVDAPAESSSSSVSPTSSDVIPSSTSSVDSSVSSSGSSTSPSASPTPGPYAGSCPARNGQCVSNYQVNCATTLVQPDDTNFAWYQVTSADQCIAYCSSESTCVGVQIVYPRVAVVGAMRRP
ncbi:hypothetical protein BDW02DRAFT_277609 [Decorospora gaudefroyi]|uniref:Chitin-binding type-1 domain-containing protein n=1 Tax=Decorospora gaudefroyi TaxID=184978 RepID=A0A6A5KII2_9PLEO|nr:hypothetical protein BDW02DRAFT_277609 [Decorospora gaudefroyi]